MHVSAKGIIYLVFIIIHSHLYTQKLVNVYKNTCTNKVCTGYRIAGKFDGEFNLTV